MSDQQREFKIVGPRCVADMMMSVMAHCRQLGKNKKTKTNISHHLLHHTSSTIASARDILHTARSIQKTADGYEHSGRLIHGGYTHRRARVFAETRECETRVIERANSKKQDKKTK